MSRQGVTVFDDGAFVDRCAQAVADLVSQALRQRDRCMIALAGGNTPRPVYRALAGGRFAGIDWHRVDLLFGDERCVPPDHAQSNYRMAREAWFEPGMIDPARVLRIRGEDEPHAAALRYRQDLAALFRTTGRPPIDITILGLGGNGHTASLFPGTAALRERGNVVAQYVEVMQSWRVTLTAPALNASRTVLFLVSGAGKADMVRNVIDGPYQPEVWPAQLIEPASGDVRWLLDTSASGGMA